MLNRNKYTERGRVMAKVRTRFAPSPTGRMHVGNLRTALYTYLIAKHEGGDFVLRIEDTDQERFVEEALGIIYRTLEKTGLIHDEGPDKDGGYGPYIQSERCKSGLYLEYAKKLIEKGEAYYCFCDKERLDSLKQNINGKEISVYDKHCLHLSKEEIEANLAAGKPYVIRANVPNEGETTFHDVFRLFPSEGMIQSCIFRCGRQILITTDYVCDVHQMIIYNVCKVVSRISVGFDQDHVIQLRVWLCNVSVNLIMESCLSLIRHICTNNKWLTCCKVRFYFFFGKVQTVLVIYTDFFTTYILF